MPRIVALSMVKNEQDIVEPFIRHTSMFVDYHVILDNGSVDETRRILTDLMREIDGIVVATCSEFGYSQSERMTRLLRSCQTAFFADYVIFLDADEFISSETRAEFEEILLRIPVGGFGRIPWRTFVLTPFDRDSAQNDPPRSMPWRRSNEHPRYNAVLRLDRKYWHDLVVAQGNHDVTSSAGRPVPAGVSRSTLPQSFSVAQYEPVSGEIDRRLDGISGEGRSCTGKKGDGFHWHDNFRLAVNATSIGHDELCDLSMRYDQPHHKYDWSTGVVRDVPPDCYERRYSSGKYAEPLALVAKSWQATLEAREPALTFDRQNVPIDATAKSETETEINAEWYWENPYADVAPFQYLVEKYRPQSVLDMGCGIGAYLTLFKNLGVKTVFGADGIAKSRPCSNT